MIDAIDLGNDRVSWLCWTCKRDNAATLAALGIPDADTVSMPPCICGAQEFLFRTWDSAPDFRHRRATNALIGHLSPTAKVPPLTMDLAERVEDLTGRRAAREQREQAQRAQRHRLIVEATRRAIVREGLNQGERPSSDAVQNEYEHLLEEMR